MSALERGLKNPLRTKFRTSLVVVLLSVLMGGFAVMAQSMMVNRRQLSQLESKIRTLIELREAGAFGTGGFGGDHPLGEEQFSLQTLEKVQRIPHARYLAGIEEYLYTPQIDPSQPNAYAMMIGLRPGTAMRAIGEIDYEQAILLAGRELQPEDADREVAVVGKLYAQQRLGLSEITGESIRGKTLLLQGRPLQVIGIYTTQNDFGDNHVFIPLETFRRLYQPGNKLSRIFVTVDSVAHVEQVVQELKTLPEADVVTAPDAVSTARITLGNLAVGSLYAALLLFLTGGLLISFVMALVTKERLREIGTLKAIGASNGEIVGQFLAEVFALVFAAGIGASGVMALLHVILARSLGVEIALDERAMGLLLLSCLLFAACGSLYPVYKGLRLPPIEAARKE